MSEMATDDMSDGIGFSMKISEFLKRFRTKPERREPHKALVVYTQEDPYAFLKRLPKVTVKPNPYSINDLLEHGKNLPLNDMYSERHRKRVQDDIGEKDTLGQNGLIDLYSERMKRRRRE